MNSYLSLIPISAKVHKRQNRMTLLCIIFAVFMVTAVFSMVEVGIRMEQTRLLSKHGEFSLQEIVNSSMGQSFFIVGTVLFLLILIAGVLMISSSINSSVAQRTQFFGMMRCIGMSKQQITRFVRLEALNWCKTAIPIGVALGIIVTWILCTGLRFFVGEEFTDIPIFSISIIGIISGIAIGVITVLLATGSPAKQASKVSPVAAISGNSENVRANQHSVNTRFCKIETALGIHNAVSAKKNLFLMTGSFALSIILFLSFSVMIDLVNHLMPQSASISDIDIASPDGSNSINANLLSTLKGMDGVKEVYGRRSCFDISANMGSNTNLSNTIDVISYDNFDLDCLKKDNSLKKGSDLSKIYGNSNYALATWDQNSDWKIGDIIQIGNEQIQISGLLKYDPFNNDGLTNGKITLITSNETFVRLTGVTDYSLVFIQTTSDVTNENVEAIKNTVGGEYRFSDKRDQRTSGTYTAFVLCVYGFLAIIALVTVLNIVNSISMSVSAKIKQYGAMRAVGMDERQVTKMIAAEAFTYALSGVVVGCVVGLLISKWLYDTLITSHFGYAVWNIPFVPLLIILLFTFTASIAAVYAPAKRMRNISVTETINEL